MSTANDIVTNALSASGIGGTGQTANPGDLAIGLKLLQTTLALWQRRRWLVWHLADVVAESTGAQTYQVGTGLDFNVPRPDRIESAYLRLNPGQAQPIDYPLYLIESREEYSDIWIKNLTSFPASVFYDPSFPSGTIYFWPIPNAQFELHILVKEQLQVFAALTDTLAMPPEYEEALMWTLAAKLRPFYGKQPDATISGAMNLALATLRMANFQVPSLQMPPGLPMGGGLGNNGAWYWSAGGGGGGNFVLDGSTLAGPDTSSALQ